MNTPVKFELAKLLKEKGFDIPTKKYYEYALKSKKDKEDGYSGSFGWKKGELNLQSDYFQNNSKSDFTSEMWYMCSAPTIADVVMWLYEKHGIWVNVMYMGFELKYSWSVDVITTSGSNWDSYGEEGDIFYYSPIEAYEAAIKYCLTELI